jgi:hypothetical protein
MSVWPQYVMLAFLTLRAIGGVYDATKRATPGQAVNHALSYVAASVVYILVLHAGNFFASLGWPA